MPGNRKDLVEFIGLAGVVASLIFVGYEIRQNTVSARAAAYQSIGVATAAALDSEAHDLDYLALRLMAPEDMSEADWLQYGIKLNVFARLGETVLLQVEQGLLPDDAMERLGFRGWSSIFGDPKAACVWPMIRQEVSDSFRGYVEAAGDRMAIDCSQYDIPWSQ